MSGEASDDPHTPVRRHSWELSSLDPSTWPVFGITNASFQPTSEVGGGVLFGGAAVGTRGCYGTDGMAGFAG